MVDEKEERLVAERKEKLIAIKKAMKLRTAPPSVVRVSERELINYILYCVLRNIQFIKVGKKQRFVKTFHNRTLNLFFDEALGLLSIVDLKGDYMPLIKNGMLEAKGKLFARPESLLSFFQGIPVPVTDINVRIDDHDKDVIGKIIFCFDRYLGSDPKAITPEHRYVKISNDVLSRFLVKLYRMMVIVYSKRHFEDFIHKDTLELKISVNYL